MDVQTLAKSTYLSLTTFRRDGTPVATPVWLARQGDELMVFTARSSGPLLAPNFAPGVRACSVTGCACAHDWWPLRSDQSHERRARITSGADAIRGGAAVAPCRANGRR